MRKKTGLYLRRCPRCKSREVRIVGDYFNDIRIGYMVRCWQCWYHGKTKFLSRNAVKAWNER